eukprot:244997-Amphidinium_carterae.2
MDNAPRQPTAGHAWPAPLETNLEWEAAAALALHTSTASPAAVSSQQQPALRPRALLCGTLTYGSVDATMNILAQQCSPYIIINIITIIIVVVGHIHAASMVVAQPLHSLKRTFSSQVEEAGHHHQQGLSCNMAMTRGSCRVLPGR